MATEYLGLPEPLVHKAKEAAAREEITLEELVQDAVQRRLDRLDWMKALEVGEQNAREHALKPEDVQNDIAAVRADRAH